MNQTASSDRDPFHVFKKAGEKEESPTLPAASIVFYIPTLWEMEFLEKLLSMKKEGTEIIFYGRLPEDETGATDFFLSAHEKKWNEIEEFVREAKKHGAGTAYLADGTCLDNKEVTRRGNRAIRAFLKRIENAGFDEVILSVPYLVEMVSSTFERLRPVAGARTHVDTVARYELWLELGASRVFFDAAASRSLPLVCEAGKRCREGVFTVNSGCLLGCANARFHPNFISHFTQEGHVSKKRMADWCGLDCVRARLLQPAEMMKSPWLAPSWLKYHISKGIRLFRIEQPDFSSSGVIEAFRAYQSMEDPENLATIINFRSICSLPGDFEPCLRLLYKNLVDEREVREPDIKNISFPEIQVLAAKLKGFFEIFENETLKNGSCEEKSCSRCRICDEYAAGAIRLDENAASEMANLIERLLDEIDSGRIHTGS